MLFRSKAPLRIGLAGGGTDVSPYSDEFGGVILNATLSLYAHTTIETLTESVVIIESIDKQETETHTLHNQLPINGTLDLVKGVYNRLQNDYHFPLQGLRIITKVDAPAGSGLGTSSTLVVSIIGAFKEMLQLKMSEYDLNYVSKSILIHDEDCEDAVQCAILKAYNKLGKLKKEQYFKTWLVFSKA